MIDENKITEKIKELEEAMANPDFWNDKDKAQAGVRELNDLKAKKQNAEAIDRGDAIMTLLSGAGGDDAEDFSRILLEMYLKFIGKKKWSYSLIHENKNDRGGYRNITIEINGRGVYGTLKNESGVHRLVRISPFISIV
ncbi:MAG TPA: PCRF domain-containing protein, partial [Candidatus Paceibacterota bacterium]